MSVNAVTLTGLAPAPLEPKELERIELARHFLDEVTVTAPPPEPCFRQFITLTAEPYALSPLDDFAPDLILQAKANQSPRALMALMLLLPAHRLDLHPAFENVPDWLLRIYATWRLAYAIIFPAIGETDRHARYIRQTIDDFYSATIDAAPGPLSAALYEVFTNKFNAGSLCNNNDFNKPAYHRQALIMESFLLKAGLKTLHSFPETRRQSKFKVGMMMELINANPDVYFAISQMERFPKEHIHITLYYTEERPSPINETFFSFFDKIVKLSHEDFNASVEAVRKDNLDLLFSNSYRGSFFGFPPNHFRLAKIQMMTAATPNTTGFTFWDVFLTGRLNEAPGDLAERYSEAVLPMDGMVNYNAFQYDTEPQTISPSRAELGAPEDAVLFISNSSLYKNTPETIGLWARILATVPDSHLLLMPFGVTWQHYHPPAYFRMLTAQFQHYGIDLDRIHIQRAAFKTRADIQALLSLCDVYLDSYPFAGGASITDPTLMNVPIVARDGQTLRGRLAGTMLRFAGLGELVTGCETGYEALAIKLGSDKTYRLTIKEKMQAAFANGLTYFDTIAPAQQVSEAILSLCKRREDKQKQLRATPEAELRATIAAMSTHLAATHNIFFATLNDAELIRLLILPYFQSKPAFAPRQLIEVNTHNTSLAFVGWNTALLPPSPSVNLSEITASHGLSQVDFLKISTALEGRTILNSHDFMRLPPALVMVNFNDEAAAASMQQRGYEAISVQSYTFFFRKNDCDFLAHTITLFESFLPGCERRWTI